MNKHIISLIGVPFSGKTTILQMLADNLGGKLIRYVFDHKFDSWGKIPVAVNRFEVDIGEET